MTQIKFFIFVLIFVCSHALHSQDLIIRKDSSKVFCKIIKEDSLSVYYKESRDRKHIKQSIAKSEVSKYYTSAETSLEQIRQNKTDSLKLEREKSSYANYKLMKGDTLLLNKNFQFEFKGGWLYPREVVDLMSHDKTAYEEIKKAASCSEFCNGTSLLGSMVAISILKLAAVSHLAAFYLVSAGTLVVTYLTILPAKIKFKSHARKALHLFNAIHR